MSRSAERKSLLKAKHRVADKLHSIEEEKAAVIDSINELVERVEILAKHLLEENDKIQFLNAYHTTNQELEDCLEKILSIQILLSDCDAAQSDNSPGKKVNYETKNSSTNTETSSFERNSSLDIQSNSSKTFSSHENTEKSSSETISSTRNKEINMCEELNSEINICDTTTPAELECKTETDQLCSTQCPDEKQSDINNVFISEMNNQAIETVNLPNVLEHSQSTPDLNVTESTLSEVSEPIIIHSQSECDDIKSIQYDNPSNLPTSNNSNTDPVLQNLEHFSSESSYHSISTSFSEVPNAVLHSSPFASGRSPRAVSTSDSPNRGLEKFQEDLNRFNEISAICERHSPLQNSSCKKTKTELLQSVNIKNKTLINSVKESEMHNIDIPPSEVPINVMVPVNITCIEDPANFWLQVDDQQFEYLIQQLQLAEINNHDYVPFIEGQFYLAPYNKDSFLHRVKLLQILSGDEAVVSYIDYGNKESIHPYLLKSLPPSLTLIPRQAVPCFLRGINPSTTKWPSEVMQLFDQLAVTGSMFAIFNSPVDDHYPVELIARSVAENFDMNITQYILNFMMKFSSIQIPKVGSTANYLDGDEKLGEGRIKILPVSGNSEVNEREKHISDVRDHERKLTIEAPSLVSSPSLSRSSQFSSDVKSSINSNSSSSELRMLSVTNTIDPNNRGDWELVVPEPKIELIKDNSILVMTSVIIDPSEFYVYIVSENNYQIDELEEQMNNFYSGLDKSIYKEKPISVGTYCSCTFGDDKTWYRVKVLEILSENGNLLELEEKDSSSKAIVQYIDYGNKETVLIKNIQPLIPAFVNFPIFAIQCVLANLQPSQVEGNRNCRQWSAETVSRFKDLAASDKKCFTAQIVSCLQDEQKFPLNVILWDSETTSVNAILAEEHLAVECGKLVECSGGEAETKDTLTEEWNPMAEEYLSQENNYQVDMDDPGVALTGYKARDEEYVCKFFSSRKKCYRGSNCPFLHIFNTGVMTVDKEIVYASDCAKIGIPEIGTYTLVQVSAVFNPTHFYVIFPYGSVPVHQLLTENTCTEDPDEYNLESLVESMYEYYSKSVCDKEMTYEPLGKVVAARSSLDKFWYRAKIQCIDEDGQSIQVFYVDFGNCEWISYHDIEDIAEKFMHLPFQAVECRLSHVDSSKWKQNKDLEYKSWTLFTRLTEGKILVAFVVDQLEYLSINLITLDGIIINDELTQHGLAQQTEIWEEARTAKCF